MILLGKFFIFLGYINYFFNVIIFNLILLVSESDMVKLKIFNWENIVVWMKEKKKVKILVNGNKS